MGVLYAGRIGIASQAFGIARAAYEATLQWSRDRKAFGQPIGSFQMTQSKIADMKNSASREGGSITAACFLGRFVEEGVKWAHLDIAGTVWSDKATHLHDKGATGYGVALLDRYLADNHEK